MSKPRKPPASAEPDLFGWAKTDAEKKFAQFDRENPQVWAMFLRFAEDRIARGFKRYSARDIIARMRWETATAEGGDSAEGWKLNNNHTSYFARKWYALGIHPELPGFFELRRAPKADAEMGTGKGKRSDDTRGQAAAAGHPGR